MGSTTRLALPYPTLSDTADVPRDIKALADKLDADTSLHPPLVTSLPGSPVDGQEIYFQADATNGIVWHFRYRAASASPYKWELIGGAPLRDTNANSQTFTEGATFVDPATPGPQITLPLAGDWEYGMFANLFVSGQAAAGIQTIGLNVGGTAPANIDAAFAITQSSWSMTIGKEGRLAAQPAARLIKMQYNTATTLGGTATCRARELRLIPVRVG